MTFILIDEGDETRQVQMANRTWYSLLENLEREGVFTHEHCEDLAIWGLGQFDRAGTMALADAIATNFLPRLGDCSLLFADGAVGDASKPEKGFSLDTPAHLVAHVSRDTLAAIEALARSANSIRVS